MLKLLKKKFNKLNSSHLISDIIFSIVLFVVTEAIIKNYYASSNVYDNFRELYSTMISIWATVIGFLITAISILMTLQDNKYLKVLKESGHFKTLLNVLMQTCYISALIICGMILVYIVNVKKECVENLIMFANVFAIKRLFSCFRILYKLIDISNE